MKNWVLKTEGNGTAREGENARLPAMTATLSLGRVGTHKVRENPCMVRRAGRVRALSDPYARDEGIWFRRKTGHQPRHLPAHAHHTMGRRGFRPPAAPSVAADAPHEPL